MALARSSLVFGAVALAIVVLVPWFLVSREADRQQRTVSELAGAMLGLSDEPAASVSVDAGAERRFFERHSIGRPLDGSQPWISHVSVVDLDQDGLMDVVLCDATTNQVAWIRHDADGSFTETSVSGTILAPAHVTPSDIDLDGDIDLLVAKMGAILPNNDKIGGVIVLENDGQQEFTTRILLDGVARVTDIEPGDFDGDGDIDLAVGQFGYDDGEIRWMENLGNWVFASHGLLTLSGTIHTPVGDLDGDGDLDIAAVVSQEWEEIYVFENDGTGTFDRHLVYGATNDDFGSSGISLVDLDLDGDLDVFVVSAFNDWESPAAASLAWFENDGRMGFTRRTLATEPTHLLALASADIDNDGYVDLVTGAMHVSPPYDRMSRVTFWRNGWGDP